MMEVLLPLVAVAFFAVLLLRLAPHLRLVDAPSDAPERKRQSRPIPVVGGSAILLGGALIWLTLGEAAFGFPEQLAPVSGWLGLALVLGFGVGLLDDLRTGGLSASQKVLGQAIAGIPMAFVGLEFYGIAGAVAAIPCGIAAMNLANTYDNADGALTSLSALALVGVAPPVALGLAAFLPFNLGAQGGTRKREPRAYLGDSGSHLIGMLLLAYPGAWMFFLLPALDLARVSLLRIRAGRHIWSGDRWHLAHRLEDRGLGSGAVMGLLCLVAAPGIYAGGGWVGVVGGGAVTGVLFSLGVWWSRPRPSAS
jgi:UDP-N-acetylmuramyl pentapeptide phosphotransferase/UDP-N-acetylglucosamine-1-phosphate transferase